MYCAIITYCFVLIMQYDMKLERSIYEVLQIFGISLIDKTYLRDLFDRRISMMSMIFMVPVNRIYLILTRVHF